VRFRNPGAAHQSVRGRESGINSKTGRRVTARDVLLAVQIALCAVLVTSSMVAVRGLSRSLHTHFGFEPRTPVGERRLAHGGYTGDQVPPMQKRMLDAVAGIPEWNQLD